ncbi:MAG: GTPase ObgE [Acidimicrobiia bacterium]|nr:GTPase ObgE [Acidimicrobiia bacterium]NNJ46295.1 GTPase ObgE [Acidimicrobiia bacterium]NNL13739.1 GTPase ObgE [Acidimicrobiia bacterium]RZV43489.1 MAG: GTPase ObgE [Acidimicrobiia bacterium]
MFVDEAVLYARGGDGGAGVAAFVKRLGKPKGKPAGGSGGRGGSVILRADPAVASLLDIKRHPHQRGGSGTHGEGDVRNGKRGEDRVVRVPLGTVVHLEDGTLLADLVKPDQEVQVAAGGRGGRGNQGLVTSRLRAPTFAEQGEYGDDVTVRLEVKLIADAALIGFPNAGKSTLISTVSAAKPKVADYPFTTLQPHLGVVEIEGRDFVLADIPGLIEGAAEGKGLGHEFLRHVERARVLVVLLDPSSLQPTDPRSQHDTLVRELTAHSPELAHRRRVVAVAKADLDETAAALPDLQEWAAGAGIELFVISAVTGEGIRPLLSAIVGEVETVTRESPARQGYVLHRPAGPGFRVVREDGVWVLEGRTAERAVNLDDLSSPEVLDYVAARLARSGITDALVSAGAEPGDDVRIGDLLFEFRPDADFDEDEDGERTE